MATAVLDKLKCCGKTEKGDTDTNESQSVSEGRATWGHTAEFLLSTVGYAVGLGNLWRFPYLCFRNGGGAFLVPYTIFLFLCGIPLVFLEMSLGQFAGASSMGIWALCPLAKGLGIGMMMLSVYCCIYYNVIITWVLYFFFNSFFDPLPWATCNEVWNTDRCSQLGVINSGRVMNSSDVNETITTVTTTQQLVSNISTKLVSNVSTTEAPRDPYPAEEFWMHKVLSVSSGIGDLVTIRWDLALTLLLAWILVFCCLIKGIKSSGKVVYVTATAPYILLTILLIQGATMPGALDGVKYYIVPKFEKLKSLTVWTEACGQIFFSLGPAWGGLITMASYNKFNTNVYRFSVAVPLINCMTSVYAGFVVFAVLGYMAKEAGIDIEDVAESGPGLIFVAYPYAISQLPVPQLWAVLFFLMVLTVGLDSQFGMFETFTTGIFDELPHIFNSQKRKMMFTAAFCTMSYFAGMFCVTHAGVYFFQLMDWYIGIFSLLLISVLECVVVSYLYGVNKLYKDIEMMIGYQPFVIWKIMWMGVTPALIGVMFFYTLATYKPPVYNKVYHYPTAAIALSWLYGISSSFPIPIYAIYLLFWKSRFEPLTLREKILKYIKPSEEWGQRAKVQNVYEMASSVDTADSSDVVERGQPEKQPINDGQPEKQPLSDVTVE